LLNNSRYLVTISRTSLISFNSSILRSNSRERSTASFGNVEPPFDLCKLAEAAGASYVARGTVYHIRELIKLIERGIKHKGFSFIDVLTPCPTVFGRRNKAGTPGQMFRDQKDLTVPVKQAGEMLPPEMQGKLARGILMEKDTPEFTEEYEKLIARAQNRSG